MCVCVRVCVCVKYYFSPELFKISAFHPYWLSLLQICPPLSMASFTDHLSCQPWHLPHQHHHQDAAMLLFAASNCKSMEINGQSTLPRRLKQRHHRWRKYNQHLGSFDYPSSSESPPLHQMPHSIQCINHILISQIWIDKGWLAMGFLDSLELVCASVY